MDPEYDGDEYHPRGPFINASRYLHLYNGELNLEAVWEIAPHSKYWTTTLDDALRAGDVHGDRKIVYERIDDSEDHTRKKITCFAVDDMDSTPGTPIGSGSEKHKQEDQQDNFKVDAIPLTVKLAGTPCRSHRVAPKGLFARKLPMLDAILGSTAHLTNVGAKESLVSGHDEEMMIIDMWFQEAVAPFWPKSWRGMAINIVIPTRGPPSSHSQERCERRLRLFDYICRAENTDIGTMMANLMTTTWAEGSLYNCDRHSSVTMPPRADISRSGEPQPNHCDLDSAKEFINTNLDPTGSIQNPYNLPPRRLWDLINNRVIDVDIFAKRGLNGEIISLRMPAQGYWAISHTWTTDMYRWMTPVNNYRWPVPLPAGTTLEQIRWEALNAGALYCWLDVLCLRQITMVNEDQQQRELNKEKRQEEWAIDIPTIGNIYQQATRVLRFYNGLGRQIHLRGWWEDSRHWINRTWSLLEGRLGDVMANACIPQGMDFHSQTRVYGTRTWATVEQLLVPLGGVLQGVGADYTQFGITRTDAVDGIITSSTDMNKWASVSTLFGCRIPSLWSGSMPTVFPPFRIFNFGSRRHDGGTVGSFRAHNTVSLKRQLSTYYSKRRTRWLRYIILGTAEVMGTPYSAVRGFAKLTFEDPGLVRRSQTIKGLAALELSSGYLPLALGIDVFRGQGLTLGIVPLLYPVIRYPLLILPTLRLWAVQGLKLLNRLTIRAWNMISIVFRKSWVYLFPVSIGVGIIGVVGVALRLTLKLAIAFARRPIQPPDPIPIVSSRCCSVRYLAVEVANRYTSHELHKLTVLANLMKCPSLPPYFENESIEDAWLRLVVEITRL